MIQRFFSPESISGFMRFEIMYQYHGGNMNLYFFLFLSFKDEGSRPIQLLHTAIEFCFHTITIL